MSIYEIFKPFVKFKVHDVFEIELENIVNIFIWNIHEFSYEICEPYVEFKIYDVLEIHLKNTTPQKII